MWYDLAPRDYAKGLRFKADRSDECAACRLAESKPWSPGEAMHFTRQARRLRAMALLCDRSEAATAGDMDFRGLHDPTLPREEEDRVIAEIEAAQ